MSAHLVVMILLAVLLLPSVALAKSDPAKEKVGNSADFKKLVDKYEAAKAEAAKKQPPVRLTAQECAGFADDFAGFGKSKSAPEAYLNAGVIYESCAGDPKKAE